MCVGGPRWGRTQAGPFGPNTGLLQWEGLCSGAPHQPKRVLLGATQQAGGLSTFPSFPLSLQRCQARSFWSTLLPLPCVLHRHFSVNTPPVSSASASHPGFRVPPQGRQLHPSATLSIKSCLPSSFTGVVPGAPQGVPCMFNSIPESVAGRTYPITGG